MREPTREEYKDWAEVWNGPERERRTREAYWKAWGGIAAQAQASANRQLAGMWQHNCQCFQCQLTHSGGNHWITGLLGGLGSSF